jgi:hypothetical protein
MLTQYTPSSWIVSLEKWKVPPTGDWMSSPPSWCVTSVPFLSSVAIAQTFSMCSGCNSCTTMGGKSSVPGRVGSGGCINMASILGGGRLVLHGHIVYKSNDSASFAASGCWGAASLILILAPCAVCVGVNALFATGQSVAQMVFGSLLAPYPWGKNVLNPHMRLGCLANNSDIRLMTLGMSILVRHYVSMKVW